MNSDGEKLEEEEEENGGGGGGGWHHLGWVKVLNKISRFVKYFIKSEASDFIFYFMLFTSYNACQFSFPSCFFLIART